MATLEEKIDKLLELVPTIEALGNVLVRRQNATERAGLNKNTITGTFEEVGKRKTYIEIKDIPVVKRLRKNKKRL